MPTLTVLVGIPGSGKTSWAEKQDAVVISTDDIRRRNFGHAPYKSNQMRVVISRYYLEVQLALDSGQDVIADATNLTRGARRRLRRIATANGAATRCICFGDLRRAVKENRRRPLLERVADRDMIRYLRQYTDSSQTVPHEGFGKVEVLS